MEEEDAAAERFNAFRRARRLTDFLVMTPLAVLFFFAILPTLGRPIGECYFRLYLAAMFLVTALWLMRRLNIMNQRKYNLLCPNCAPKPILRSDERAHLSKGECPRCLGRLSIKTANSIIIFSMIFFSNGCAGFERHNTILTVLPHQNDMKAILFERDFGATTENQFHVSVIPADWNIEDTDEGAVFIGFTNDVEIIWSGYNELTILTTNCRKTIRRKEEMSG